MTLFTRLTRFSLLAFVVFAFSGCSKTEGKGGLATIRGKILMQDYNLSSQPNGEPVPAQDVKVYIIYGNGTTYADDFDTSYDGSYEFKNLRKGNYKIFVYQDIVPEPADPPKTEAIVKVVTIGSKKDNVTVPDITINVY